MFKNQKIGDGIDINSNSDNDLISKCKSTGDAPSQNTLKLDSVILKELIRSFPQGILILQYIPICHTYKLLYANKECFDTFNLDTVFPEESFENFKNLLEGEEFDFILSPDYTFKNFACDPADTFGQKRFLYDYKEFLAKKTKFKYKNIQYNLVSIQDFNDITNFISQNLIKEIKTQYLLTISHELNNPLNNLVYTLDEIITENPCQSRLLKLKSRLKFSKKQIKFFINNFITSIHLVFNIDIKKPELVNINLHFQLEETIKKMLAVFRNRNYSIITKNLEESKVNNATITTDFELLKMIFKNIYMYIFYYFTSYNYDLLSIDYCSSISKAVKIIFDFKKQIKKNSAQEIPDILHQPRKDSMPEKNFFKIHDTTNLSMIKDIIISIAKKLNFEIEFCEKMIVLKINLSTLPNKFNDCSNINEFSPYIYSKKDIERLRSNQTIPKISQNYSSKTLKDLDNNIYYKNLIENEYYTEISSTTPTISSRINNLNKYTDSNIINKERKGKINNVNTMKYNFMEKYNIINSYTTNNITNNIENHIITSSNSDNVDNTNNTHYNTNNNNSSDGSPCNAQTKHRPLQKARSQDFDRVRLRENIGINKCIFSENYNDINICDKLNKDSDTKPIKKNIIDNVNSILKRNNREEFTTNNDNNDQTDSEQMVIPNETDLYNADDGKKFQTPSYILPITTQTQINKMSSEKIESKCLINIDTKHINETRETKSFSKIIYKTTDIPEEENEKCECNTVLIVDDERLIIESLKNILKKINITSDSSQDGKDCILKIQEKLKNPCCKYYKIILMDYLMPNMNGIEASKIILDLVNTNVIKPLSIIMITAHDSDQMHEKLSENKIITKM